MKCLLPLLLSLTSVAALAQTTGTVNPSSAPADASAKEDVPPGGCMPIGLTASGEIVFPIQCRELIERERGKTMEQKPVAVEQKPAAKQSESEDVTPVNSQGAIKRVETIAKRVEPKRREPAISGCRHFRTYDAATRTYTNTVVPADKWMHEDEERTMLWQCNQLFASEPLIRFMSEGYGRVHRD